MGFRCILISYEILKTKNTMSYLNKSKDAILAGIDRYWMVAVLIIVATYLGFTRDIEINLELTDPVQRTEQEVVVDFPDSLEKVVEQPIEEYEGVVMKDADPPLDIVDWMLVAELDDNVEVVSADAHATFDDYRNATIWDRIAIQRSYVTRYSAMAVNDMNDHGVPASITLAQGILESAAGTSRLAVDGNNHFGVKCFSKKCMKGHCMNYSDDSHKDFFRMYDNVSDSYAHHSRFLKKDRYRSLFKLKITDYRGWARGLKKAGYATDPNYDKKLISLIESLKLYKYDIVN